MKTHENKDDPLQCIHCEKKFTSFELLNKHKRAAHPRAKTAECPICQKQLCSKASLSTHMLIHNDVKNYKCSFCFKEFRHAQALKKHEQLHKNPNKPNQCVICEVCLILYLAIFFTIVYFIMFNNTINLRNFFFEFYTH